MKKIITLFLLLMTLAASALANQPTDWSRTASWSETFTAGSYDIIPLPKGFQKIEMVDFSTIGAPGNPQLPCKIYNIALPPTANFQKLTIQIQSIDQEILPGTYDIAPAPPCAAAVKGKTTVSWGKNTNILGGKNINIYNADSFFGECVKLLPASQMRKWQYTRVQFCPFQYNPVSKKLALTKAVTVELVWSKKTHNEAYGQEISEIRKSRKLLQDNKADRQVKEFLYNVIQAGAMYDQAEAEIEEYEAEISVRAGIPSVGISAAPGVFYNYVIITTNEIEANLNNLNTFKSHLVNCGLSPLVITEDEYGSLTGQAPNGTAEKIRQWLINNYIEYQIEYVLLVGDPHPASGDVPMKMCYPYQDGEYDECPTDYFYADLTGNWDLNGDQYFGTFNNDNATGGVDFAQEVAVGRIPLISGNYAAVDGILQKIMDYENASGDLSWREKLLMPMAESNHTNEDGNDYSLTDGRDLPEDTIDGYASGAEFAHCVFYEKAGLEPVPDNAAYDNTTHTGISSAAVLNEWQNAYGCVFWWGHGSETGVYRKYWNTDDGDGIPEAPEMLWPAFFTTANCGSLDDSKPSIVYQSSCNNGYPEDANNLGYALLKAGAVATVSASRVSWYMLGNWFHTSNPDNTNIGFVFMENIISNNDPVGKALFNAKNETILSSNYWDGQSWMNRMDFNLYGAPHVRIEQSGTLEDLAISIPENFEAPEGATISVPVNLSNTPCIGIQNIDIVLTFDASVLDCTGATLTGGALESLNYEILSDASIKDQITIGVSSDGPLFDDEGTICYVNFLATGSVGESSGLDFTQSRINGTNVTAQNGSIQFVAPPAYPLTVIANPNEGGDISVDGTLQTVESQTYDISTGTSVSLEAMPSIGYSFDSWSGNITGITNPVAVTMDTAKEISANFANNSPFADAGPDQTVNGGHTITLDGTGSFDTGGSINLWNWTIDSGTIQVELSNSTTANPTFVAPNEDGWVIFQLTVTDNSGNTDNDTVKIIINADHYFIDDDNDGYSENDGDCNDSNNAIYPDATEICDDGIDNDCDNQTDLADTDCSSCVDNDGDGYFAVSGCGSDVDCDDADADEHPGQLWYKDEDNDGYSGGTTLTHCERPTDHKLASELMALTGDCDDYDGLIHPDAAEICGDGIDQDCNGSDLLCPDSDDDGVFDFEDNCPNSFNPDQNDIDNDGIGDSCDDISNIPGDVNGDGEVSLEDLILALKICADVETESPNNLTADVDGDGKIGMAEAIYILENISGLR